MWNEMYINVRTHTQDTIDDRAAQNLLPATTRRLPQHKLCHLALAGDLDQRFGNVATARTNDLCPQVFGEYSMLLQAALRSFTVLLYLTAAFDATDEFAHQ